MIDSSSGERTSSFQSPTIIAIIPISNLPFPEDGFISKMAKKNSCPNF